MRALAERATHRLVFKRRLPRSFGRVSIYVSTEGGLRYLFRRSEHFDPPLYAAALDHVTPGSTVWDVGANVGLFAFAAASAAGADGTVLAIEPDVYLATLLGRSAAGTNVSCARVDVLAAAVADNVGLAEFVVARRSRSTNYLLGFGTTETGGEREHHVVPTVTLDWLLKWLPPPDVVKIDVEGAERLVLAGAGRLLDRQPVLLCEVAGENAPGVGALLRDAGYRIIDGYTRNPASLDDLPYFTIAVPDR